MEKEQLFRKKIMDRISSPEQLTDYLRVTTPGIWVILGAVLLLLAGLFVWASIGTLETKADASVIVEDHQALIIPGTAQELKQGMTLRVASEEYVISRVEKDEYGRSTGRASVDQPDGAYEGEVVVEKTRPIDFLLISN